MKFTANNTFINSISTKKANISLTTVLIITSILLISSAALVLTATNLINGSRSRNNQLLAETRGKSCLEESLSKIRLNNTFTGDVQLSFPDNSSCKAVVANQVDPNLKQITFTSFIGEYSYTATKTVNISGIVSDGSNYSFALGGDVLAATTTPNAVTWYQAIGQTDNGDDKNSALHLSYNSYGMVKGGRLDQNNAQDYVTLLSAEKNNAYIDYRFTSTGLSSLNISTRYINVLDTTSRQVSILVSKDNGSTFTTAVSSNLTGTGTGGTIVQGTVNFANSIGGSLIVRLRISGANTSFANRVGFSNITFTPTASTFEFVPRISNLNVASQVPTNVIGEIAIDAGTLDIAVKDRVAYAVGTNNIQSYNIENPNSPTLISQATIAGIKQFVIQGKYLYGIDSLNFVVIDISNPASMTTVSTTFLGSTINSIFVEGKNAYVSKDGNFHVFDLTNPAVPTQLLSTIAFSPNTETKTFITDKKLYYYTGTSSQMIVLNTIVPEAPAFTSALVPNNTVRDAVVQDKYVYTASNSGPNPFLNIYTWLSTSTISLVSNLAITGVSVNSGTNTPNLSNITVNGDRAYITDNGNGNIFIFDISDPQYPVQLSTINSVVGPTRIVGQGRFLYVLYPSSLKIYEVGGAKIENLEANNIETSRLVVKGGITGNNLNLDGALSVNRSAQILKSTSIGGNLYMPYAPTGSSAGNIFMGGLTNLNQSGLRMFFQQASDSAYFDSRTTNVAGSIRFRIDNMSGGTERFTIQSDGNVGVGVSVPSIRLDVGGRMRIRNGSGGSSGLWLMNAANNADRSFIGLVDDNTVGLFGAAGAGWGLQMNVVNGNIGINTTPPSTVKMTILSSDNTVATNIVNTLASNQTQGIGIGYDEIRKTASAADSAMFINAKGIGQMYLNWRSGSAGVHIGNGAGNYGTINAAAFTVSSSARYKKDITNLRYTLSDLLKLDPKTYKYINDKENKIQAGFIAEEVDKIFPEAVTKISGKIEGLDYGKFVPLIIQSIKDQQLQMDSIKNSLDPNKATLLYFTLSSDTLSSTYNINTSKGITAQSLNVKGAITSSSISANCGSNSTDDSCASFAQRYDTNELTEVGDIVELNLSNAKSVRKTSSAKSNLIVGVVTDKAGFILGIDGKVQAGGQTSTLITTKSTIVGFAGKVYVKVNLENGEIKPGDKITSSTTKGFGMKANGSDPVIGIALEGQSQTSTSGRILVLLSKN